MSLADINIQTILSTALNTVVIFCTIIFILRVVSARVFSQSSPEYLMFLLLLSSGMYSGITGQQEPSIINSITIGVTLLITVIVINKFRFLRRIMAGKAIILVKKGIVNDDELKGSLIDIDDLNKMAREYGFPSYKSFHTITLEKDGKLTGIIELNNDKDRIIKRKQNSG